MSENEETQVKLDNVGLIDIPSFDCTPHIGKEVKIAKVTEHRGSFGYYIRVETEKVAEFGGKDISASRIFGLNEDAIGNIGWGKDTKLGIYLQRNDVSHYKDLVGKNVILQTRVNKDGLEFLDFV